MSIAPMRCYIAGIGTWGPGFNHWRDLQAILSNQRAAVSSQSSEPRPECIPANERRRAPLPVRLAIEASSQATRWANISPANLSCVFASGIGDCNITDHLCRAFLTEEKLVSPTKFHNSVHNAAAGYWTMSVGCMQSANSISGFDLSVPLALMEGLSLVTHEQQAVLVTVYDAPSSDVLEPILGCTTSFSAAIVLTPEDTNNSLGELQACIEPKPCDWQPLASDLLQPLYQNNPSARILTLLEALISPSKGHHRIIMPVSNGTSLGLNLNRYDV